LTIYFEEHRKGLFGPCWFSIYGTKKSILYLLLYSTEEEINAGLDRFFISESIAYTKCSGLITFHSDCKLKRKHTSCTRIQELYRRNYQQILVFSFRIIQMLKNHLWIWVQWKLLDSS